jgi:hypothetical protein
LGIATIPGQNDVQAGIQQVRGRMQHGDLYLSKECRGLRDEAEEYRAEDRPDGEFKVVKENDHRLDAMRYAIKQRPWFPQSIPLSRQRLGFIPDWDRRRAVQAGTAAGRRVTAARRYELEHNQGATQENSHVRFHLSVPSTKAVVVVGKDQAARVTNTASSGTLYIKSTSDVTSSSNDFSIAAAGSRLVNGPAWGIGSVEVPVLISDLAAGQAADAITPTRYWMHGPKDTSTGTDTTVTANRAYVGQINIPRRQTFTGAGFLIGGTGGTHKAIVALYDKDGNPLAYSAIAGVTVGTANTYQELPFVTPLEIVAPGNLPRWGHLLGHHPDAPYRSR